MEIGNEIGQKIRSAIKAKLVELGAYVDDELPDYIMVMVANKKTQTQMSEDLSLFLATNTAKFTTWLHVLLEKLQSLTADASQAAERPVLGDVAPLKDTETSLTVAALEPSGGVNELQTAPSREAVKQSTGGSVKQSSGMAVKQPNSTDNVPMIRLNPDNDEFEEEGKAVAVVKKESSERKPVADMSISKPTRAPPRVDNTRAPPRVENTWSPPRIENTRAPPRIESTRAPPRDDNTRAPPRVENTRAPPRIENTRAPPRGDNRKRAYMDDEQYVPQPVKASTRLSTRLGDQHKVKSSYLTSGASSDSNKKRVESTVGAVLRHDIDDEYDPYRPAIGNVASTVTVTQRKSSVPVTMQANKSLLFRAMKQAEQSVASIIRKHSDLAQSTDYEPSSKHHKSIQSRLGAVQQTNRSSHSAGRRSSRSSPSGTGYQTKHTVVKRTIVSSEVRRVTLASQPQTTDSSRPGDPTTLRGHDPATSRPRTADEEPKRESKAKRSESPERHDDVDVAVEAGSGSDVDEAGSQSSSLDEQDGTETSELANDDNDHIADINAEVDLNAGSDLDSELEDDGMDDRASEAGDDDMEEEQNLRKMLIKQRSASQVGPASPKFVVTLDGAYQQTEIKEPLQQPARNVVRVKPQLTQSQSNTSQTSVVSDDPSMQYEDNATKRAKLPEKCKYYPACKNTSCLFHHPSIPCKMFPSCQFGVKCMYVHPDCKFDTFCRNLHCPYQHTSRGPTLAPSMPVIVQPIRVPMYPMSFPTRDARRPNPQQVKCKFYPNCMDINCTFLHPKPCRYGTGCTNQTSCPYSHPRLPNKNQMKWVAGSQASV